MRTRSQKDRDRDNARYAWLRREHKLMRLWFTEEEHAQLTILAKRRNCTMIELVRTYIEWGLENDNN